MIEKLAAYKMEDDMKVIEKIKFKHFTITFLKKADGSVLVREKRGDIETCMAIINQNEAKKAISYLKSLVSGVEDKLSLIKVNCFFESHEPIKPYLPSKEDTEDFFFKLAFWQEEANILQSNGSGRPFVLIGKKDEDIFFAFDIENKELYHVDFWHVDEAGDDSFKIGNIFALFCLTNDCDALAEEMSEEEINFLKKAAEAFIVEVIA